MNIFLVVGEILLVGLLAGSILIDTPLSVFADVPSILFVVGIGLGLTIISFSLEDINKACSHIFGGKGSGKELRKSLYLCECSVRNLLYAGVIGTFIGAIKMLQNLSDPANIGPSMAVAMLTFFYAIFLSLIGPLPSIFILKKQLLDVSAQSTNEQGAES